MKSVRRFRGRPDIYVFPYLKPDGWVGQGDERGEGGKKQNDRCVYSLRHPSWKRHFLVRYEGEGPKGYIGFDSPLDFYRFSLSLRPGERVFHEVVSGQQKPHFDIDIDTSSCPDASYQCHRIIDAVVRSALEILREKGMNIGIQQVLVYTSHGPQKKSAHVVLRTCKHWNPMEAKRFYLEVLTRMPPAYQQWVDPSPYKSIQNWRILGMTKAGQNRWKQLSSWYQWIGDESQLVHPVRYPGPAGDMEMFLDSLLGHITHEKHIPGYQQKETPREYVRISSEFFTDESLDQDVQEKAFRLLADHQGFEMNQIPYQVRSASSHTIFLNRMRPSFCPTCQRTHENENPMMIIHGTGQVYWDCRRSLTRTYLGQIELPGTEEEPSSSFRDVVFPELEGMYEEPVVRTYSTSLGELDRSCSIQTGPSPVTQSKPKAKRKDFGKGAVRPCIVSKSRKETIRPSSPRRI